MSGGSFSTGSFSIEKDGFGINYIHTYTNEIHSRIAGADVNYFLQVIWVYFYEKKPSPDPSEL